MLRCIFQLSAVCSHLKQLILLLGRCFLVLLLSDRLRLSLLLVVLFRMSLSIKQNSMIADIVCAPLYKDSHTALYSSASCRHSFLVLLSSAVLLLLSAAVAALPWDVHLFSFSFCFFRACVASVRYDMFVCQEGECILKMAPH